MTNPPHAAGDAPADDPGAPPVHIHDPAPLRQHADLFAARLDVATLAAAGIPAQVIEPDGPAAGTAMDMGRPRDRVAIVMVPSDRLEEAREELAEAGAAGPAGDFGDSAGPADAADATAPFRPRGMPIPARIGLVVAATMLLLGVAGAIAMLFIGP